MAEFERLLSQIEPFRWLEQREIELILPQSCIKNFRESEIVFFEEEETPYWYFVAEGKLKAYKTDKTEHNISLCSLETGMAINDIRVKKDSYEATMFATVESITKGSLIGIKAAALPLLFAQIPKFALICLHGALFSVERYQRAFFSGMILDGTGKVAFMLANDLARFNTMKKQDIAAMLNIQPETLSRILGKLARKGIIEIDSDIAVTDIKGLREFYE
jgi:CRP/FNR family transcriptional regulator